MESWQLGVFGTLTSLQPDFVIWESTSTIFQISGIAVAAGIIIINVSLIKYTIQEHCLTFFNHMLLVDCFLCLANVPAVLRLSVVRMSPALCWFFPSFGFFINMFNRLLSNAIMVYRYVFVLHSTLVLTPRQRFLFSTCISLIVFGISASLAALSFFYRDHSIHYLGKTKLYKITRKIRFKTSQQE